MSGDVEMEIEVSKAAVWDSMEVQTVTCGYEYIRFRIKRTTSGAHRYLSSGPGDIRRERGGGIGAEMKHKILESGNVVRNTDWRA